LRPFSSLGRALDPLTRSWALLTGSQLARLALTFVASVLIARHLGPADFGLFTLLGAVMTIAGVLADFGLTTAGVREIAGVLDADTERARLWGHSLFWLRALTALLILAAGGLLAGGLSWLVLGPAGRPALIWLALLGMVLVALTGAVNAIFQATGRFRQMVTISLVNAGLTVALALLLAAANRLNLITALVVLGMATSLAGLIVALRLLPAGWRPAFPGLAALRRDGRQLFLFGRWLWLASLIAIVTGYLDLLLLNRLSSPGALGAYALALNLAAKVDVVNQSLTTVLLPAVTALRESEQRRAYIRRILPRSLALALAVLALLPLARPFIQLFYGADYRAAAPLFQLMLATVAVDVLVSPLLLLAFPLNRPRLLAAADGLRGLTLLAIALPLIPILGPAGAVIGRLGGRLAGAAFALLALRRAGAQVAADSAS
jgi:O-antigen/teichoic acid export membrane protein